MTSPETPVVVDATCSNLRQGDVVDLSEVVLMADSGHVVLATPRGVAILSQTCDVVQESKQRCLVAPVAEPTELVLSDARKGKRPLHLYLASAAGGAPRVADMERATSVPKSSLAGRTLLARSVLQESSVQARNIGARVGRAFTRFPFPDEVYPAFEKLRNKAQKSDGNQGAFAQVLDMVLDLRVSSDQWDRPGRNLSLVVIVAEEHLIPEEDRDPAWKWGPDRVKGVKLKEVEANLDLNRVCELIVLNVGGDSTTLLTLWNAFGRGVQQQLLQTELAKPDVAHHVHSFEVEVLSDIDMTYRRYNQTESLDLEVLSDSGRILEAQGAKSD